MLHFAIQVNIITIIITLFCQNKNTAFNNTIEIQLAGRQKKHKVHEAGAHVIHNSLLLNYKHT